MKTDIDIKMFEKQVLQVSKNMKSQEPDPCSDTFYIDVTDQQPVMREYDFHSAADFRKMLEEREDCGVCIFRQFDVVCTASLFKYYSSRREDTEHRKVSDFTYEF